MKEQSITAERTVNKNIITAEDVLAEHTDTIGAAMKNCSTIAHFPDPSRHEDAFPVRIFTLGRFSILVNGEQPVNGRKTPHRPMDLLKVLIAMGGRRVSCNKIAAALWPEVDGDSARTAFDTTLYRLRKFIGHDQALRCVDGTLSLDATQCWVDVWAFERLIGRVSRMINTGRHQVDTAELHMACLHMLRLYQDHFLQQDDGSAWSVSMRERLRSKFVHYLVEAGACLEKRGAWSAALDCYRKGLEVDDLIEIFYQRIMVCYLELDRISEGMATYRRCRQILSIVLGLKPEPRTESIHDELKHARINRVSA
jgi:two-component SAPR family response regulator